MEFAGGLRGADGPEPNSKNFDPFGFSEARPENLLFFREAEIKVRRNCMHDLLVSKTTAAAVWVVLSWLRSIMRRVGFPWIRSTLPEKLGRVLIL